MASIPLVAIEYWSSYCIVTWSVRRLCSSSRSLTSRFQIWDLTDIPWVTVNKGQIWSEISGFSIVTQRILVGSHIWDWEVTERLELHNLRTNHVTLQSELKYLIGGKGVMLKCLAVGGKTGPFWMGRGVPVVTPITMIRFRVELDPEATREFGAVANTHCLQLVIRYKHLGMSRMLDNLWHAIV